MGDKVVVEKEEKTAEPPKFELGDLPPPPDFSGISNVPKPDSKKPDAKELPEIPEKKQEQKQAEKSESFLGQKKEKKSFAPGKVIEDIKEKSSGLVSKIFRKKPAVPKTPIKGMQPDISKIPPPLHKKSGADALTVPPPMPQASGEGWIEEGEKFREAEMLKEADDFREKEMGEETEKFEGKEEKKTPLKKVKGIGPKTEKKLRKAGIESAEHLAEYPHDHLTEKAKMPLGNAKKILKHAKKLTGVKTKKKESISDIVKSLEKEKKTLEKAKDSKFRGEKIVDLEGHKEILEVLQKLESKRDELVEMQKKLEKKEQKLGTHDEAFRREMEHVDKMKRNLDHDVRERTQHLIDLEKEYFQKAQNLAKDKAEIEVLAKKLEEQEKMLKEKEQDLKKELNALEDREITVETKEKKFQKILEEIEKRDQLLREKEDDLEKREADYMKKLDILQNHENKILKNLEQKRKSLEKKEKELRLREKRVEKTKRNIDKKSVAVEYAKNVIEEEKGKLVDDEFHKYLHDQVNKPGQGVDYDDVQLVSNLEVPDLEKKSRSIYQLVDKTKTMLNRNRVQEAKVYYNQLRERYYETKFSSNEEKEKVHNLIRTLYDEINLADVGSR